MSRRPAALSPRSPGAPSRAVIVGLGALLALALGAVLFPWFPGARRLVVDTTIDRAIVAPRDIAFESSTRTAAVRERAAAAIDDVYVLDPALRDRQIGALARIIGAIEQQRRATTLSASARETAIRSSAGTSLSQTAASVFAAASEDRFQAMSDQAVSALGRTLTGAVGAADVDAARTRAQGFLTAQLAPAEATAVAELIGPLVAPTLVVDQQRTEALRREAGANTPPVHVTLAKGQVAVPARTTLTAADVELLGALGIRDGALHWTTLAATALFAALLAAGMAGYVAVARPPALRGARRLALFAALLLVPAATLKFALPLLLPDLERHFAAYALPVAAGPIVAAVLLDVPSGVVLAALIAAVAGYASVYAPGYGAPGDTAQLETARLMIVIAAGSFAGLLMAARADRVQRYLAAGFATAAATAVALLALLLIDPDRRVIDVAWIAGAAAVGGLLAAIVAVGVFMLFSRPFGIITRVELMELAQLNHPLLRRLQDEAPGTFQHSILVGNLAERAADRMGADALLVRVGAYYHDIGKLMAPQFFVENLAPGASPHEHLDPLQSTRVIQQHVTGGVEIARRAHLPEAVVQFIPEHHGTRVVTFFYRRAAELRPETAPDSFRYPGPRPQSRETALVMIADAAEATVRSSADRTPERIRQIVDGVVRERIEEGQFDECTISLQDLRVAADSYSAALSAVYHPRVEYPAPTRRELAARGAASAPRTAPESRPERAQPERDNWSEDDG